MKTEVFLWNTRIGGVVHNHGDRYASFQYSDAFIESDIQVAPLVMPLSRAVYRFPALPAASFHGLPGLLADSLPDKFGNALIDAWLSSQGRSPASFSPLERLCYSGARGMGALEFRPAIEVAEPKSSHIEISSLVRLASEVLAKRGAFAGKLDSDASTDALHSILQVGTSAGGARAKAVIAWNRNTNEVRSGQVPTGEGFEYWLLKFDGVSANKDKELDDPQGFGILEYAYSLMAKDAGIKMSECRLLEENGRSHFMTRRFDRLEGGQKLHMQSLGALAHYDFNAAGAHSYESAIMAIRQLGLKMAEVEEQFRRMVFNILARNQDDHVKNIAFLMDKNGDWSLSPAFDVNWSYNPDGAWTSSHQMTVNGKRDDFEIEDLEACAEVGIMKRGRAREILEEVQESVGRWPKFAAEAGLPDEVTERIGETHRNLHAARRQRV